MHTSEAVIIREADERDLDAVVDLWEELIEYHCELDERYGQQAPDGRETMRQWLLEALSEAERLLLVAESGGKTVGFLHGMIGGSPPPMVDRRTGLVTDLAVAEGHRRRGIGSRLMEAATQWFSERGAGNVTLSAAVRNEPAIAFYRARGFDCFEHKLHKPIS